MTRHRCRSRSLIACAALAALLGLSVLPALHGTAGHAWRADVAAGGPSLDVPVAAGAAHAFGICPLCLARSQGRSFASHPAAARSVASAAGARLFKRAPTPRPPAAHWVTASPPRAPPALPS